MHMYREPQLLETALAHTIKMCSACNMIAAELLAQYCKTCIVSE